VNPSKRQAAKEKIADYLMAEIENHTQGQVSPVNGRKFAKLSKDYAKAKKKEVGHSDADLHLSDDLMNGLGAFPTNGGVRVEVAEVQAGKAHNHNTPKTKKSTSPKRQFIPDDRQKTGTGRQFKPSIRNGYKAILKEFIDGD